MDPSVRLGYKRLEDNRFCILGLISECNNETRPVYDPKFAKFRTSKVKVLDIYSADDPNIKYQEGRSTWKTKITYRVGEIIDETSTFDQDEEKVCGGGIHYFLTEAAARSFLTPCYVPLRTYCPDGRVNTDFIYMPTGEIQLGHYYEALNELCDQFRETMLNSQIPQIKDLNLTETDITSSLDKFKCNWLKISKGSKIPTERATTVSCSFSEEERILIRFGLNESKNVGKTLTYCGKDTRYFSILSKCEQAEYNNNHIPRPGFELKQQPGYHKYAYFYNNKLIMYVVYTNGRKTDVKFYLGDLFRGKQDKTRRSIEKNIHYGIISDRTRRENIVINRKEVISKTFRIVEDSVTQEYQTSSYSPVEGLRPFTKCDEEILTEERVLDPSLGEEVYVTTPYNPKYNRELNVIKRVYDAKNNISTVFSKYGIMRKKEYGVADTLMMTPEGNKCNGKIDIETSYNKQGVPICERKYIVGEGRRKLVLKTQLA